jgi:hypothetical protein
MGKKHLVCDDPGKLKKTWFEYDEASDTAVVTTEYDVEPILDRNKALASAGREHYASDKDMWHAAEIPVGIILEWQVKHGVDLFDPDHWDGVKRLLNSNEYAYLRTGHFKL